MSSSTFAVLVGAVGIAAALAAATACSSTSETRAPPSDPPETQQSAPAEHVYHPHASAPPPQVTATTTAPVSPAELAKARRVALAEARAVCNFDWHQSLDARLTAARRYATAAYAQDLTPSATDATNWRRTQHDRESGSCTASRAHVMSTAPNSATVLFERVRMQQHVSVPRRAPSVQTFEALYRVERQYDGRWLVGGEGDGG